MGSPKGKTNGRKFSKDYQPAKNGRKPGSRRMEAFVHAMKLDDEDQELSREDATRLLRHILLCNKAQLEAIARNADLPIAIIAQIKGITTDLANGKTDVVDKIWDKIFGKTVTPLEITGANGTDLIPKEPMSRKDYEALYKKLKCGA